MALPEKELELLQSASDQLSTSISRFGLLRLTVLAVLVFTFAKAFKQIDQMKTAQSEALVPITGVTNQNLEIDRFRDFFLLDHLLSDRAVSVISSEPRALDPAAWNNAREVLVQYKDTKEAVEKFQGQIAIVPSTLSKPEGPGADNQGPTDRVEIKLPDEIVRAAQALQQQLARETKRNYSDAFGLELGVVGTKVGVDLRNWLVFFPFLFLFSEIYLLIQRKKRKLLGAVLLKRVEEIEDATPKSVPTVYRLLLRPGSSAPSAYSRQPRQFVASLYSVCSLGLLAYLGISAKPFFEGVGFFENLFTITVPVLITLVLATLYSWSYYLAVSARLEEEVKQRERIESKVPRLLLVRDKLKTTFRRVPRFWLTTGGGLVLLTLLMATSLDSCGRPKRGYDFTVRPVVVKESVQADGTYSLGSVVNDAWWFPALWSMENVKELKLTASIVRSIDIDQRLGWITYLTSLLLAAASLLLVLASLVRPTVLHSRAISLLLYLTSGALSLFFLADICLYFVSPRLKLLLLGFCFGLSLVLCLLLRRSDNRRSSERSSKWRAMFAGLWMPIAICTVAVLVTFAVYYGLVMEMPSSAQPEAGLGTYVKIAVAVLADNFAMGLLTLLIGLSLVWLGWRQLYEHSQANPEVKIDKP